MKSPIRLLATFCLALALVACAQASAPTPPATQPAVLAATPTLAVAPPTPASSSAVSARLARNLRAACPVTSAPAVPFTPPAPYPAQPPDRYMGQFWYGSPQLWTMVRADGTWSGGLPYGEGGYTQKVFWWRQGYNASAEQTPNLTVTGRRLDGGAPPLVASRATNASADFGDAMLIGVEVPTLGCWELTGHYQGYNLTFVVWIAP